MNDKLLMEAENPLDKAMEAAKAMQKDGILPVDGVAHPEERTAQTVAVEIRTLQRQAQGIILSYAIEIGRKLEEAKAMVPFGEWGEWLKRELDYSPSTAQNLMKLFREYGEDQMSLFGGPKSQTFGNLTYSKALKLLAIPDADEREQFAAENDVEHMSVRELDAAIKARDDALNDAQNARFEAQKAKLEADAAREKAEQIQEAANRAREDLAVREQSYMENMQAAEQEKREAEAERDQLRRELEERPVVEDREAVANARREAIAEMNDKVKAAKAEREAAEAERKAAAVELDAMRKELDALKEQASEPQPAPADDARVREMEKKLAAANPEVAEFKVLFAEWQEKFQRMDAILEGLNDTPRAGKLLKAMQAALDVMIKRVEARGGSSEGRDDNETAM